jgi:hypothetical protein
MLKMLSNILAEQCLTIVQSVLILIGALKKAGSGAVVGVAVKSEMSTVQIMIQEEVVMVRWFRRS